MTILRRLAILAFLCPGACHAWSTLDRIRETQTIVIAYRESSIPFSYVVEPNHPIGYAIDLCLKVAEAIKHDLKLSRLDVRYIPVTPANRMQAIAEGQVDLECGSTTNTADRRRTVAFSIPHFIASARMMVRASSGIHNWSDLHDKSIVTTKGTTNAKTLADRDKLRSLNLTLLESRDHAEGFGMVAQGKAAAFAMDDVLLYGLRATAADPDSFQVVGDSLSTEPYAIMLRKDDPAFKSAVDMEVARLMIDGDIFRLYDKWFMHPIPPHGINLRMPMGPLLRASLRYPSDKVAD